MTSEKTVLVVSDKPEQFDLAVSSFQSSGYRVRSKRSLTESVTLASTENPVLIISELAVPDIDGFKLCRNIRKNRSSNPPPILLVGDLSKDSSIVSDAMLCGATDYLQRPFTDRELLAACEAMTGLSGEMREADENLFDALIENISDSLLILSADGIILFGSPSTQKVMQYRSNELLGACIFDWVHPDDVTSVRAYFTSVEHGTAAPRPVVYRLRQEDGSWKLIHSVGRAICDARFGPALVLTSRPSKAQLPKQNAWEAEQENKYDLSALKAWKVDIKLLSEN